MEVVMAVVPTLDAVDEAVVAVAVALVVVVVVAVEIAVAAVEDAVIVAAAAGPNAVEPADAFVIVAIDADIGVEVAIEEPALVENAAQSAPGRAQFAKVSVQPVPAQTALIAALLEAVE
ncbi:MAG: hypothetical protein J3R72DRAFT_481123 [Linnemannia gamsii]|nr:MAG: hypothetical protein J3R72DRAFT_481123 [Linnemannia gamsii]